MRSILKSMSKAALCGLAFGLSAVCVFAIAQPNYNPPNPGSMKGFQLRSSPGGFGLIDSAGNVHVPGSDWWIGNLTSGDVTSSGNVAATGSVTGGSLVTTGSLTTGSVVSAGSTSSNTPGTIRNIYGKESLTGAANMASGNLVGVRGEVNVAGTATAGASSFMYGTQGKLIVAGTLSASSGWLTGVQGQIDLTGATGTTGNISTLWGDVGGSPAATFGNLDLLRLTNSTSAIPNSIIFAASKANYFAYIDSRNNDVATFVEAAGTGASSCAAAGGAVCAKAMKVKVDGADYWIPLYSSNTN